jgi:hypothetical protein
VTRAAPVGRAAPLSSTRRFDPESPNRWLVRARFGHTSLCGSERGELSDVGRSASNGAGRSARRLLGRASRAKARRRAKVPQRHSLLPEPSLAPQLDRPSGRCRCRAQARRTTTRASDEDGRRAPARDRAARGAGPRSCTAQGRDLPRLRAPLLRPGAQSLVVRVPPFDASAERPISRPLPDGLERAATVRPRADGTPAGDRRAQILRGVGPGLEPVELQALVPVLVGGLYVQTAGDVSGRGFLLCRPSGRCPK